MVELGGQNVAQSTSGVSIRTPTATANNDVTAIAQSVNSIVQSASKIVIAKKEAQNVEDEAYAKQTAIQDAMNIENAILSGNSEVAEYNDYVAEQRAKGFTDTEVSRGLYDLALEKRSAQIGEEVQEADKAYLIAMSSNRTKSDLKYAPMDRERILDDKKDVIYSTANIINAGETAQIVFDKNVAIGSVYNMPKEQVEALTIQRAFDLAKRGDESLLDQLDTITSNGIKLIDTTTGSTLYNKLTGELEATRANAEAKLQKEKSRTQVATASAMFGEMFADNADLPALSNKAEMLLATENITLTQYNAITKINTSLQDKSSGFAPSTNVRTFSNLYARAFKGELSQTEALGYMSELNEADGKSILKLAVDKGGIDGLGNEESNRWTERIKLDADSIGDLATLEKAIAGLDDSNAGKIQEKLAYAKYNLNKDFDTFVNFNKRLPTEEEYYKMFKNVEAKSDKKYDLSISGITTATTKPSTPSKSLVGTKEELFNTARNLSQNELKSWYDSLNPEQKKILREGR